MLGVFSESDTLIQAFNMKQVREIYNKNMKMLLHEAHCS